MTLRHPDIHQYKSSKHARRAGRRHALAGKPPLSGLVAWPGNYMDGYKSVTTRTLEGTTAVMTYEGDGTWTCSADCPLVFQVDESSDDVASHLEWHVQTGDK